MISFKYQLTQIITEENTYGRKNTQQKQKQVFGLRRAYRVGLRATTALTVLIFLTVVKAVAL